MCYIAIGLLIAPMGYVALTLDEDPIGWLAEPGSGAVAATLAQTGWRQLPAPGNGARDLPPRSASRGAVEAVCLRPRIHRGIGGSAASRLFAVSRVKPILLAKYLIVALPAMALLAAGAITSLRPVGRALADGCVLLALSVPEVHTWYEFRGQEDWRTLTTYLLQQRRT